MARETMQERLADIGAKVQKLRDKGSKWAEISSEVGVSQGKAMLAYMFVTTDDKDRIKFKTDDDLAVKVVKARESGMSWGTIAARAGTPESKVRRMFEVSTGQSTAGHRVGKGGRHPGENGTTKTAKATPVAKGVTKSAAAKKATEAKAKAAAKAPATVKKAAAKPKLDLLTADVDALSERMEGRKIKVTNSKSNKDETFSVKTVKSADEKTIVIIDARNSAERTFNRSAIKGVSGR